MLKKLIYLVEVVVLFLASTNVFSQSVSGPNKADAGSAQCYFFSPPTCSYGSGVCWNVGGASYAAGCSGGGGGVLAVRQGASSAVSPSKVIPMIPPGGCSCSGGTSITVTMPSVSSLSTITVGATGQCCSGGSVTVTVVPALHNVSISPSSQSVNCGSPMNPSSLSASTPSGGDGTYYYQWQSSPDGTTWTSINGATSSTYVPPGGSSAGTMYYHVIVTSFDYTVTSPAATVSIVASPLSAGAISNPLQAINYNTVPATINCSSAGGGSCSTATYNYLWYSSTDSINWSSTGVTTQNYSPGALTRTTWFKRLTSISGGASGYSNAATVVVYPPLVSGTISPASQSINYNTAPGTLTISGTSGGNGSYSYQWQSSPDNSFSTPTNVGPNAASYNPPALTSSLYYHVIVTSNGVNATSGSVLVTVYPQLVSGTISPASQTVNYNTTPGTLTVSAASGGNGTYTYQWYSSATSNGTYSSTGVSGTSYTPSGLSTAWYEAVATSNSATVTSAPVPVYVRVGGGTISGPSAAIAYSQTASLGSTQDAVAGNCQGSYNYQWFQSPTASNYQSITGATSNTYTTGNLTASTWFIRQVSCGTETAWSNAVLVNVNPLLSAGALAPAYITLASGTSPGVITASPAMGGSCNGGYVYQWQSSPDGSTWSNISVSGLSFNPGNLSSNIYYRVQVTCGSDIAYSNTSQIIIGTPPSNLNYIRARVLSRPGVTDTVTAKGLTSTVDVQQSTQYFDGLGRPIQAVAKQASPLGYDMVSLQVYDPYGREATKYMPYTSPSTDGNYKPDAIGEQSNFNGGQFPTEQFYYSQVVYETSPLNRILSAAAPGNSWVGGGKVATSGYLVNSTSDSVHIWNIVMTQGSLPSDGGLYPPGQLFKHVTIDEQNHQVIEYKNIEGHVVLKKVQLSSSPGMAHVGWLCTYYVYDDLKNLRFVIQPRAMELINTGSSWTISQSIADELCFRYEYDSRNRIAIKKLAGAGEAWNVYDVRDRLVFSQDANQRASGSQWLCTLYDGQNRVTATGLINYSGTQAQLQQVVTTQTASGGDGTLPVPGGSNTVAVNSNPIPSGVTLQSLTFNFYDDYSWVAGSGTTLSSSLDGSNIGNGSYFITSYNSSPTYAVQPAQYAIMRGMPTGTMSNVLGSSQYLTTVNFYDDRDRIIQSQEINLTGSKDITTHQYDFTGRVLRTYQQHQKGGNNPQAHTVLSKMSYDPMGRLLTLTKTLNSTINGQNFASPEQTITSNQYNELGQLRAKYLGGSGTAAIDSLVYEYNIRGWLTSINKQYLASGSTSPTNYFGMELGYDKPASVTGTTSYLAPAYNGNVAGLVWKSAGDGVNRKYDFSYDNVNRLTGAAFLQNTSGSAWDNGTIDFSVSGLSYDANGNILAMKQKGFKIGGSALIDDLTYTYLNGGQSNKLAGVSDGANDPNTKLGDFHYQGSKPVGLPTLDYTYDGNGNLTGDNNKSINQISYNYLNLPQQINMMRKGYIQYLYDASGNKLKKIVTDTLSRHSTTTLYINGFVYQQADSINNPGGGADTLQFLNHEEGRVRWAFHKYLNGMTAYGWEYDFFEKDHLGNTRVLLTQQKDTAQYLASMEAAYRATENALFYNIPTTCVARQSAPGYPADLSVTNPNDSVSRLNGNGPKVGPAIILKVMSGDKVNIGVNYYYNNVGVSPGQPLSANDLINSLASGIVAVTGGAHGSFADLTGGSSPLPGALTSFIQGNNSATTGKPNAYLNWVLFDNQFKFVSASSGALQVGAYGTQSGGGLQSPLARSGIPMTKSGYLYIYVSNSTPGWDVFFDNLSIKTYSGAMLEETHYYPFGLTMAGISDKALKGYYAENKFRFGDKELQNKEFADGSGLETYDFGARTYDPQLGRWLQADPLTEYMRRWSPYAYGFNNPLRFTDPGGTDPHDSTTNTGEVVRVYDAEQEVVVTPQNNNSNGGGFWGSVGSFLWEAVDYIPYAGSIKQIGVGIAHGSWKEAGMGLVMLTVDIVSAGEGGEAIRLAEKGAQVLAEDEIKEIAEKSLVESVEKHTEEEVAERTVGEIRRAGESDAHHIIQDAAVKDLPGYSTSKAPGIRLDGPSTKPGTPHYNATQVQKASSGYRRGTYARERVIGYKALKAAGIPKDAAKQYIRNADKYFKSIGVDLKTVTRIPLK